MRAATNKSRGSNFHGYSRQLRTSGLEQSESVPEDWRFPMELGPAFWLIMAVGVAVLVGVALAYGLLSPRLRRRNTMAARSSAACRPSRVSRKKRDTLSGQERD